MFENASMRLIAVPSRVGAANVARSNAMRHIHNKWPVRDKKQPQKQHMLAHGSNDKEMTTNKTKL